MIPLPGSRWFICPEFPSFAMSAPDRRNRLDEAASPYLQQHADNPVHWQPWDEHALTAAAERDAPIFLSVGYAACHWCHVMEEESFEDPETAAVLNDSFVPIKVDREERPDVDRIYQTICQLVTGQGGWPLSAWLTPERKPFYVGTYFPPEAAHGRPSFRDVLERIRQSWAEDRTAIEERADEWTAAITDQLEPRNGGQAEEPETAGQLGAIAASLARSADRQHGGFGTEGPKFPQPQRIEALLWAAADGDNAALEIACEALDAMGNRGMYDHVGGGFHRYATDREWRIPHFEKMLYDNATLPPVYLGAYQLTGRTRYRTVVEETFEFVDRELGHPDGGFYSTLDAQSEGQEGTYYVWTPRQIEAVLDADRAEIWCERYGVTASGNFEHGSTVLARERPVAELAEAFDRTESAIEDELASARKALFDAREERPRPARDEKVLAGWNGLMISALAEGGLVLDEQYAERGCEAATFVLDHLWDEDDGRLFRRVRDGDVGIPGYLDDYAYLGDGLLKLHSATGELSWLRAAIELREAIEEQFWDAEDGVLYYTPSDGEEMVSRPTDPIDQSLPSSTGVAAMLCRRLDPFLPEQDTAALSRGMLAPHRPEQRANPTQHLTLALASELVARGMIEWTVVADELPEAWRAEIAKHYVPRRLVSRRPPDVKDVQLRGCGIPPIWADRTQRDGEPTAYLCRAFTCSPPLTDPADAGEWLERLQTDDGDLDLPG